MALAKKPRKRNTPASDDRTANEPISHIGQPLGLIPQLVSRIFAKDALLEAAENGWGTTFRYAFLLLAKRISAIGGIWVAAELAHTWRWF